MTVSQLITEQHRQGEETNSILDIGCGNGGFFEKLDKTDYFKSDSYGEKNFNSKLLGLPQAV